jgi:hypothetical protein
MGSTRVFVVLSVLLPACVQRGVDSPLIGLGGGEPATAGKDSSPDMPEPEPESESESEDSETTGATSPKDPPDTDSADAGSGESSSGEPADASTTDEDEPADDSSGGTTVPTGDPMWWHCSEDADCESGVCVIVQVAGEAADGFCSGACNDAWSDCDAPDSGTAQPICVAASVSICGLDCTPPATCPNGMGCIMIAESPVPVCV